MKMFLWALLVIGFLLLGMVMLGIGERSEKKQWTIIKTALVIMSTGFIGLYLLQ